jgi:hypothetical protein
MTKSETSATVGAACAPAVATKLTAQVPKERQLFRALLAGNPNYFGNLETSPLPAVLSKQGDTTYEEIGCVGFHPQSRRLDAVVFVKQASGYSGNICTKGSQECVRFYVSFDNGVSWVDQGAASFTVYDVAQNTEHHRLEYSIGVPCFPPEKFCLFDNVLLARAILSWDHCPPANQPNWIPVWGEVHNTHIQVQPRKLIPWFEVFNEFKIKLPAGVLQLLDLDQNAVVKAPAELSLAQLHALYADKGIEPHRYALPAVQKLLAQSSFDSEFAALPAKGLFGELGIDPNKVINALLDPGDGSTFYEQLECIGFNPVTSELIGVLRTKRPNGYSGGTSTNGSREYVTFWADFDNNGTWDTCLGTASVQVFDVAKFPNDGLEYAVYLPVDFNKHKRICQQGARLVRIRAVLSWNSIASCPFPTKAPVWGNHEETLILLPPGKPTEPGDFRPLLFNISTAAVCDIDQGAGPQQGLTNSGDRPFGGAVYIVGAVPGADSLPGPDRIKYKLSVREYPGGAWQPLANTFGVSVDEHSGAITTQSPLLQSVDGAGYYTYRDFGIGSGTWRRIAAPFVGLLGQWNTAAPMTGLWEIRVEAFDTLTLVTYVADTTLCPDATTRTNVIVALDEDRPVPVIAITAFSTDGGATWGPAADCEEFTPGVWVQGTYSVSDAHFSSLNLNVEPVIPANGATPVRGLPLPNPPGTTLFPRSYPAVSTNGEGGVWSLNTAGMDPCGYIVRIDVGDRTIVSANGGWTASTSVGFCLRQPT